MRPIVEEDSAAVDDHVDDQIASCLSLQAPRSFFLFAGAGSGKTRSLVNALDYIAATHGPSLRLRGQQVGVITYTNAACNEIVGRIKSNPLFHVSTIHSFVWDLIRGLDADIREWLRQDLAASIDDLEAKEAAGRAGTQASLTRQATIESKRRRLAALTGIKKFIYSPTGDNREMNSLNHAEVIKICADFLTKPLMQRILVNQYPFLLIDESQDTNRELIDALLAVEATHEKHFCLGLIGDTMQRIYSDGKDGIERELPKAWLKPEKRLNHRCPKRLVRLINQVRSEVDRHVQEPRPDSTEGFVRLFVLPADSADKYAAEEAARVHMAEVTGDARWATRDECKILALEHHMAAKRMGFEDIFDPLYAVETFRTSLLDGTLPAMRFFCQDILPLVAAQQRADRFETARVVRERSPILSKSTLVNSAQPQNQLAIARDAVKNLMDLWLGGEPDCGAILDNVAASGLFLIPDSLQPLVGIRGATSGCAGEGVDAADSMPGDARALLALLAAPFSRVPAYEQYVTGKAPFDTHQGVKGQEFDRVMVIMDDAEARGFMFGYEKLFGARERSSTDLANEASGKETSLDRTRRLFYVTSSRAKSSLALVAYSADPQKVKAHVLGNGWFDESEIVLHD